MHEDETNFDIEILKIADHHFLHDLQQFWQRSTFFVLVQGGLLSVFASIAEGDDDEQRTLALGLAAFGVVFAIFWGWVSQLTSDRIATWRDQVMRVDEAIDPFHLFAKAEGPRPPW